jgi:hypothetical protein
MKLLLVSDRSLVLFLSPLFFYSTIKRQLITTPHISKYPDLCTTSSI